MHSAPRLTTTHRRAQPAASDGTTRRGFFACLLALFAVPALRPRASATTPSISLGTFPVAGFQFHDGPELLESLRVGDALELVPEPDNPYDEHAIRAEWRGAHIGYVPRRDNAVPARLLADGRKLRGSIEEVRPEAIDPWATITFEIRLDTAPERSHRDR